jgi:microsomal dipeptidase-like Zn-dependent dipeptidase
MTENISEGARSLYTEAIVWDMVWPWEPWCGNGFDKMTRFHDAGFTALSATVAGDNHSISEAVQRVAAVRDTLLAMDHVLLCESVDDVLTAKASSRPWVLLHFEGTSCFERNLDMVEAFYKLGIRQTLLAFNNANSAGGGAVDDFDAGLTPYGRKFVQEMARVGMLLDLSHTGHKTALDAIVMMAKPCVYTHSSPQALYTHPRNISDEEIKACAATGGLLGIPSSSMYHGDPQAKPETLFRHLDYIVQMVGAEHARLGLDYVFDAEPLDAQRESGEAYILSQKHEGCTCLPEMYDDGGISGATLERPALKRLLEDIEAGRIDAVVVCKVDRLTRSLGDFAKIVEVFDRWGVSFVSVTQQFNTTTSMGRLTLNMLLSFAQFEREVTGERICDKIAASKKKGMWMGGTVPLGYDVKDRKLVVNEAEAETVRHIYRRYAELGSVRMLKELLDRDGIVSKVRVDRFGRTAGGKPLARGALYLMLQNRIYVGEIVHKENSYPGKHEAIIDRTLWDEVQHKLKANRVDRGNGVDTAQPRLLAGLIYDDAGERMTPSHANKKGTRCRYYVSQGLVKGSRRTAPRGRRVPAGDLEALVEDRLRQFLTSETDLYGAIEPHVADVNARIDLVARAADLAERWPRIEPSGKRAILMALVDRIDLMRETLEVRLPIAWEDQHALLGTD